MTARLVWFPELDQAIVSLRAGGATLVELSLRMGITRRVVTRRMDELGLPRGHGGQWGPWRRGERPVFTKP